MSNRIFFVGVTCIIILPDTGRAIFNANGGTVPDSTAHSLCEALDICGFKSPGGANCKTPSGTDLNCALWSQSA